MFPIEMYNEYYQDNNNEREAANSSNLEQNVIEESDNQPEQGNSSFTTREGTYRLSMGVQNKISF